MDKEGYSQETKAPTYISGYDRDMCIESDEPLNGDIVLWIKSEDNPKFSHEEEMSEDTGKNSITFTIPRKDTEKFKPGKYKWILAIYDKKKDKMINTDPQTFIVENF